MATKDVVVGIDLGTTNSSVAWLHDGVPELIAVDGKVLLPSVVGLSADGTLLVGDSALNQEEVFPGRTIRSIKRRMGEDVKLALGDREYRPVEISAMILRRLKRAAEEHLGGPVHRAVITVPAYFSDAQRTATREAGEVAGLTVERILNEPTAAALCYSEEDEADRVVMVYDLGGGTFDVSIVRQRGQVTEVLASHGNTKLGGDDFDQLLLTLLRRLFEGDYGVSLDEELRAMIRLKRAAEATKIALSTESYVQVTEEHLAHHEGIALHLDYEIARHDYEDLIRPLLERTKDSVQTALREAGVLARDLDDVILVGGSTRTPLVNEMLRELLGRTPRRDVNPDHAVALGAALQAGRIAGEKGHILVDVTPFTFGTSHFGYLNGMPSPYCFKGIIKRNTPIPTRQTEVFYTMVDGQQQVEVNVYQGEDPDARNNIFLGRFMVEGLDPDQPHHSPVHFELRLDTNGILDVEVRERHTGLVKKHTIEDAFRKLTPDQLAISRQVVIDAFGEEREDIEHPALSAAREDVAVTPSRNAPAGLGEAERTTWSKAVSLVEKARRMAPDLVTADRNEVEELVGSLDKALDDEDFVTIRELSDELADVLFYLEG